VLVLDTLVVERLLQVLDEEARLYEDILKISKNKTDVIVKGNVAELENIVKIEQSIVLRINELEDMRDEVVGKLSAEVGLKPSEVSISSLLGHLKGEQAEKLKCFQERMMAILGELKNINELNAKLINNSLEYINFSINLLAAADAADGTYGSSGQINSSGKRSFIDMKL